MADELFQKRAYELQQYIQLVLGEIGYEDPASIWIALDRAGWPEAMRISLAEFVNAIIGAGNSYYLNGGVPWINTDAVLAGFPLVDRKQYDTVNIAGIEYQFQADRTTLILKSVSTTVEDNSVSNNKLANLMPQGYLMYRKSVGNGNPEYQSLATLRNDLNIPTVSDVARQNVIQISFPTTGTIAERIDDAVVQDGIVLAAIGDNGKNLSITHNLVGREFAYATVKSTDLLGKKTVLVPFRDAYSGLTESESTIIIAGLAGQFNDLKLDVFLIFK